jgi:hypothetical protein
MFSAPYGLNLYLLVVQIKFSLKIINETLSFDYLNINFIGDYENRKSGSIFVSLYESFQHE